MKKSRGFVQWRYALRNVVRYRLNDQNDQRMEADEMRYLRTDVVLLALLAVYLVALLDTSAICTYKMSNYLSIC